MALIGFLTATGISIVVCGLALVLGRRLRVVDHPDDDLKTHSRPAVPLGGVGIMAGLHVGLWLAGAFDLALLVATLVVWVMGLVDDLLGLSPVVRLAGAGVAGVLLALLSDLAAQPVLFLLWAIATVVVVNATNLLDGLDGMASAVAIASLAGLWWFGTGQGSVGPHFYVISMGAILGFLVWNTPPARMFLGDNGAYVVGVTLTWAALRASPDGTAALVGLAIIGVPILDLAVTAMRRLLSGQPLFSGDRDHTYDLLARDKSVWVVVTIYVLVELVWATALVSTSIAVSDLIAVAVAGIAGLILVTTLAFRQRPRRMA